MPEYLKLDSRKLSFGEYWNIVRSPLVIIPWTAKLFGLKMRFGSGFPRHRRQREMEILEQYFPAEMRQKLQPWIDGCQASGFYSPRFFFNETIRGETQTGFVELLHSSGQISVRLFCSISWNENIAPKTKLLAVMLSELSDGRFFVTSNQKRKFADAPGVLIDRLIDAVPVKMLESHLQRLMNLGSAPERLIKTDEAQDELWDRYERTSNEFGLTRGVYVVMTPEEVAVAKQARVSFAPPPPPRIPPMRPPPIPQ